MNSKFLLAIILCLTTLLHSKVHTFAIVGDGGRWSPESKLVRDSILKSNIQNLILPGDNLYDLDRSYSQVWSPWRSKGLKFPIVALGNHFITYKKEMNYFNMPNEYFIKVIGEIRFIVLNSDNQRNIKKQMDFLEKEFAFSKGMKNYKYTFLVFHHPPATISFRHNWQERKDFHLAMRPILRRHQNKIDSIIVGHDHQASFFTYGGIPVIVSGAIFEYFPAKYQYPNKSDFSSKTYWAFKGGYYWTRIDIDTNKNQIWINFVRAIDNKVSCSIRLKGKVKIFLKQNCHQ